MAPGGGLADIKHRIRRANPMRIAMEHTLAGMDHADAEQIRRYQERRMRMLIRLANQRSPFYRNWFRGAGVDPYDIHTLEDLGRLPLLSRRDLAEHPDDFKVYPRSLMWKAQSSGTSGSAVCSYRTPGSSSMSLRYWNGSGVGSGFPATHGGSFCAGHPSLRTQAPDRPRHFLVQDSCWCRVSSSRPTLSPRLQLISERSFRTRSRVGPRALRCWHRYCTTWASASRYRRSSPHPR